MANLTTNLNLTQIAIKRLSGKAMTNSNFTIAQEPIGSTVQTAAGTIFGEAIPPSPDSGSGKLNIIQSSSVGSPGSVQLVMFEITASGTEYQNTVATDAGSVGLSGTGVADEGETTISTFHAYALRLTGSYVADNTAASSNFNSLASTPTDIGSFPYEDNAHLSGSIGRLQILPEYVGLKPGTTPNPYTPVLFNQNGTEITPGSDIDWYLDPYSGIIFVQDPVDYETGDANSIPTKLQAFIYTGKYQDQMSYGITDISLHISASEGDAFDLVNNNTASFESGSAGITVTADTSKKITIGKATDNVQFANLTGSNLLITNTASITYFETTYESSSIIYSSGSTKFGDTNDDTHIFTGSVAILYTGSGPVGPEYGLQMSGSNFLIDYGESGSVTLGTHNVGFEFGSALPITGSGLIISQSFTNEATTHNMVKIGETELLDVSGSLNSDSFLINVRNKTLVISSSELNKPAARVEAGNTAFYGSTSNKEVITIANDIVTIGTNTANTTVDATNLSLLPATTLTMGVGSDQEDDLSYSANKSLLIGQNNNIDNGAAGSQVKAAFLSNIFPLFKGAVTASAVSSSGLLFASASDDNGTLGSIAVAMYDTASGRLYYTGSSALGDTTSLEASASAGIFLSASEGTGFSIGLMQSASFTSGSGDGLTVEAGVGTNNIEFTLVGVLSSSQQIATDISGAIDAATGSLLTDYGLLSGSAQIATEISGAIGAATASLSASIVGTANEVEVVGTLGGTIQIGLPDNVTIAGDLTVNGTTTSINTDQLLVEDPFILLASSSSDPNTDGGIIIQTDASSNGTALFYDNSSNRWALAQSSSVAHNATSATAHQFVVSVSSSTANPTGAPSNFGLSGNSLLGMMYVATTDNDNDTNTIWIYG